MKSLGYLLLSIVLFFGSIILFIFFLHYHHKKDISTYENLPEVAKEVGFVYIDNYVNNYCKVNYYRNSDSSTTINLKPQAISPINDIKVFGELGWSNATIKWINKYTFKTSDGLTQIDSISMIFNDSIITLKSSIGDSFVKYFMNENDIDNFYSGVLSNYNNNNNNNKKMLLFSAIIFFIMGIYFFIVQLKLQNKEIENDKKFKEDRDNRLKEYYSLTNVPVSISNPSLHSSQVQTKNVYSGALLYAQPREYSLIIPCINVSDKNISAIEFEVNVMNAFNEVVSRFKFSKKVDMVFGVCEYLSYNLTDTIDIDNSKTIVKRVMFSDGTFWNR